MKAVQGGFPRTLTPYKDMARQAGIDVEQLFEVLNNWKRSGKLRRLGAIVNHFKTDLDAAAMVVWRVGQERVERVGEVFAEFEQVSHAYERQITDSWTYNLYTMVHGQSSEDILSTVKKMSKVGDVADYRILATKKELKKVPPTYIVEYP